MIPDRLTLGQPVTNGMTAVDVGVGASEGVGVGLWVGSTVGVADAATDASWLEEAMAIDCEGEGPEPAAVHAETRTIAPIIELNRDNIGTPGRVRSDGTPPPLGTPAAVVICRPPDAL